MGGDTVTRPEGCGRVIVPGPKRRCNRRLGPVVKENLCTVVSIVHKK